MLVLADLPVIINKNSKSVQERIVSRVAETISELIETHSITDIHLCLSGGLDSVCLLEILTNIKPLISASLNIIHVNHNLSPHGYEAEKFCTNLATQKKLPFIICRAPLGSTPKQGIEAWARNFRYESVAKLISKSSLVLTAHHAKDQTETLIHHIIRGSGPYGLAGMPRLRKIGDGWLFRPLLDIQKEKLEDFSRSYNLRWIEDPTNRELRFLRNKIRKLIIPNLEDTFVHFEQNLKKMANIQRNLASYIDDLTEKQIISKLQDRRNVPLSLLVGVDDKIRIFVLQSILRRFGVFKLGQKKLEEILRQITEAKRMKQPSIDVGKRVVKIHKGCLFVLKASVYSGKKPKPQCWSSSDIIDFSWGTLHYATQGQDTDIKVKRKFLVTFRKEGEKINLEGRCTKKLKKLFQELSIPPWERPLIPIIYEGGELVALGGVSIKSNTEKFDYLNKIKFDWKIYYSV